MKHVESDYSVKRREDGVLDYGKVIVIDLDGTILAYEGWQGPDTFGEAIPGAVPVIQRLRKEGWYIIIHTTRLVTVKLVDYLIQLGIPFDDINARVVPMEDASPEVSRARELTIAFQEYGSPEVNYGTVAGPVNFWYHNPPHSSAKPIASVYVDDMNWENEGRNFTEETWTRLYESLVRRFGRNGRKGVEADGD